MLTEKLIRKYENFFYQTLTRTGAINKNIVILRIPSTK